MGKNRRQGLAISLDGIGNLKLQADEIDQAHAAFAEALEIRRVLAAQLPDDPAVEAEVVRSLYNVSLTLTGSEAVDAAAEALAIALRLEQQNGLAAEQQTWPELLRQHIAGLRDDTEAVSD